MSNVHQIDPYQVGKIVTLGMEEDKTAKELLTRIARQVQPILKRRRFTVPLLKEFFPKASNLLGLNVGGGGGSTREINIRLRRASSRTSFYPYESLLGTMLHEIAHNIHGPHKGPFYKLLDELTAECEDLMSKGIAGSGAGFDIAPAGRIGGRDAGRPLSMHERREAALKAAEERAKRQAMMPVGPHVVGGNTDVQQALPPALAAAAAAERRARDNTWCPSEALEVGEEGGSRGTGWTLDAAIQAILEGNSGNTATRDIKDSNGIGILEKGVPEKKKRSRGDMEPLTEPTEVEVEVVDLTDDAPGSSTSAGWDCLACTFYNRPMVLQCEGRVPKMSYEKHNKAIRDATIKRVERMANASEAEVTRHLATLSKEWDMERTLMLNASIAAGTGILLSVLVSQRWLIFSGIVLAFLAQHAIQGYCPPMVWFRAWGWRTAGEIEDEVKAVRLLHGRALPSSLARVDKNQLLEEMLRSKRSGGAFVGEGPNIAIDRAAAEE